MSDSAFPVSFYSSLSVFFHNFKVRYFTNRKTKSDISQTLKQCEKKITSLLDFVLHILNNGLLPSNLDTVEKQ